MSSSSDAAKFFNRVHALQGAQLLSTVFTMFGVAFAGTDTLTMGRVRLITLSWAAVGLVLAVIAAALAGRARSGIGPLLTGAAIGFIYFAAQWVMARGGS
jgi:hypothetical protein